MSAEPRICLAGRAAQAPVEILLGKRGCDARAPLIAAAEIGYSPLGGALQGPVRARVTPLADALRNATDGAYFALIDSPAPDRRLALIQSDRSGGSSPNFYQQRHARRDTVWRDFYYATVFATLAEIDAAWLARDVELSHPRGSHGWPSDLLTVVLEAIGHLADHQALHLRRIFLTCGEPTTQELHAAVATLNGEQVNPSPPSHREILAQAVPCEQLGVKSTPDASLWRINLP
jgi:hypothetical protein